MGGLFGMIARSPELAAAAHAAIIEPRAAANRLFLRRAIERGEISPDCDVDTLAVLAPAMATFRVLVEKQPVDAEYLVSLIDGVLLPAAGIARSSVVARSPASPRPPAGGMPPTGRVDDGLRGPSGARAAEPPRRRIASRAAEQAADHGESCEAEDH